MARKTLGPHATVYQGENGDWYWNFKKKGRITAEGGEGYRRRADCVRSLKSVMKTIGTAQIIIKSNE